MITVYSLPGAGAVPSISPFCAKVEVYLRMVGLPYRTVLGDGRKAPKGKLPYVDDEGVLVADSSRIVAHFEQKLGNKSLDHGMSDADRARAHVIKRLLEESLYFSVVWTRWAEPAGWELIRGILSRLLPAPLRPFLPAVIRRVVLKQLHAQGIGRHRREEIHELGVEDVRALATILGEGPFVLGEEPRAIDATVYAFATQLLRTPFKSPIADQARSEPALVKYVERMDRRFDLSSIPVLGAT